MEFMNFNQKLVHVQNTEYKNVYLPHLIDIFREIN